MFDVSVVVAVRVGGYSAGLNPQPCVIKGAMWTLKQPLRSAGAAQTAPSVRHRVNAAVSLLDVNRKRWKGTLQRSLTHRLWLFQAISACLISSRNTFFVVPTFMDK